MPEPAYMTITVDGSSITEGALGEDSVGNYSKPDQEGKCLVQAFEHSVHKPTDDQSGQVSGPRQHRPCVVTKLVDKVSPVLYENMCHGKICEEVLIEFYRTDKQGTTEPYYTVTLKEAVIVDMRTYIPNCLDPVNSQLAHLEEVSFSYKAIDWEHTAASTQGSDAWGE